MIALHRPALDAVPVGDPVQALLATGMILQQAAQQLPSDPSAPLDRQVLLDLARGEVRFGRAIHQPDGGWRRYGAVSPVGATMRLSRYRQGGGGAGNVARRALTIVLMAIPRIASATDPRAATGGVDAESLDGARERARLIAQAKPAHVNYRLRVRAPSREQGSGA